jgi:hypothetical protein
MADDSTQVLNNRIADLERDLEHLTTGVALLGIKRCFWCKKFYRTSEAGLLFDSGATVCFNCIPAWWPQYSTEVTDKQREIVEFELKNWLIRCHHAEAVRNPEKLPKDPPPRLQIVVSCYECKGTGDNAGERCRFCDGRGSIWVLVQ